MNQRIALFVTATMLGALVTAHGADHAQNVVVARTNYVDVAAHLDRGGDLYVISNVEGALQTAIADLTDVVNAMPPGKDTATAKAVVSHLGTFLFKHGFYALKGVGLSVVPRADGLNNVKFYAGRDPRAASTLLWKAWVGGAARRLSSLDYLPTDTVLARAGTSDPKALWRLVQSGVHEVGATNVAMAFDKAVVTKGRQFGVSIDGLVSSLGEEGVFAIQLSKTETVTIPTGATTITIPAPSLLAVLAVRDARLHDFAIAQVTNNGLPIIQSSVDGTPITSVGMPLPFPVACQPTLAMHRGFLLIGSTPEVVKAALEAASTTNGLIADQEFKTAFAGQRMDLNNGILYVSPRFGDLVSEIQGSAMAATPGAKEANVAAIQRLLRGGQLKSCAMVIYNLRAGVMARGTSSSGGREIGASAALAPIGLLAGIAVPSFIKARTESQSKACINNLRILDAAKEQWAMETVAPSGAVPNPNGFLRYVKGGRMPVCPQNGTYTLGNIGTDPRCSIPKHRMRPAR